MAEQVVVNPLQAAQKAAFLGGLSAGLQGGKKEPSIPTDNTPENWNDYFNKYKTFKKEDDEDTYTKFIELKKDDKYTAVLTTVEEQEPIKGIKQRLIAEFTPQVSTIQTEIEGKLGTFSPDIKAPFQTQLTEILSKENVLEKKPELVSLQEVITALSEVLAKLGDSKLQNKSTYEAKMKEVLGKLSMEEKKEGLKALNKELREKLASVGDEAKQPDSKPPAAGASGSTESPVAQLIKAAKEMQTADHALLEKIKGELIAAFKPPAAAVLGGGARVRVGRRITRGSLLRRNRRKTRKSK